MTMLKNNFMNTKKIHFISGLTIAVFVGLHLFNHFMSIWGADRHIAIMDNLRHFYRNIFIETILILAVLIQIITGIKLFISKRKMATTFFDKVQIWSGLYLSIFFVIHVGVVFAGRILLHLDTNFYFGVAGLNSFPLNLFFIPYYGLAIISFFGHLSAVHKSKMKRNIFGLAPAKQANIILFSGMMLTIIIFYGLTNHFKGVTIPKEYNILIGK
jgi:hypothetical protein